MTILAFFVSWGQPSKKKTFAKTNPLYEEISPKAEQKDLKEILSTVGWTLKIASTIFHCF